MLQDIRNGGEQIAELKARSIVRTSGLTCAAIVCFAANSLACRVAVAANLIDPASFTFVRAFSALVALSAASWFRSRRLGILEHSSLRASLALLVYLLTFSYGYGRINTGMGALILFGVVQIVMYVVALREGEKLSLTALVGLALAMVGLGILMLPGIEAPDLLGALLMAVSGAAWGSFCLLARGVHHPIEANAGNFLLCLPMVGLVNVYAFSDIHATTSGVVIAVFAGAVASGVGYVLWYLALDGLTATRAATIQLAIPVMAALGGTLLLGESVSLRFLAASGALFAGIALVFMRRSH